MRTLLFFVLFAFSTLQLGAGHLAGGEIYFKCLGGAQYELTLNIYHYCNEIPQSMEAIATPQGSVSLTLIETAGIVPSCGNPNVPAGCDTTIPGSSYFWLERSVYRDTVTLIGTPPPQGWKFSWSRCCRPFNTVNNLTGGAQGMYLEAIMYQDSTNSCSSSAQWQNPFPALNTGKFELKNTAVQAQGGDSLYYLFASPMAGSNTPVTFASGYSATNPFPDPSELPSNGPVTINSSTGTISTDIQGPLGLPNIYYYAVEVETWRGGNLIATTKRDFPVILEPQIFGTNIPPTAIIDTALWDFKPIPNKPIQDANGNFHISAELGDTLYFEMSATDFGYNTHPSGALLPQQIAFKAAGIALDSRRFMSPPVISPKAPQPTFRQALNNNVTFLWVVDSEYVASTATSYYFQFSFEDDACPLGLSTLLNVEIQIKPMAKGIDIREDRLPVFEIYPNPTTGKIFIAGIAKPTQLEITDLNGRQIRLFEIDPETKQIDLSGLASGVYLAKIGAQNLKLVVE